MLNFKVNFRCKEILAWILFGRLSIGSTTSLPVEHIRFPPLGLRNICLFIIKIDLDILGDVALLYENKKKGSKSIRMTSLKTVDLSSEWPESSLRSCVRS